MEKKEKWSLNSGKWAYGDRVSSKQDHHTTKAEDRGSAKRIAVIAATGLVFGAGVWLGSQAVELSPRPAASIEEDPLRGEIAELKQKLDQQKRALDERQRIIDEQKAKLDEASRLDRPADYTVSKTSSVEYRGTQWQTITEHQFLTGDSQHWARATCYLSPVVDGVKLRVDLVKREAPDFRPDVRVISSETLLQARMQWPDVFYLGSKCIWLDGALFSPDQLSTAAPAEVLPEVQAVVPSLPMPGSTTSEPVPPPDQRGRRVFEAKDLIGGDGGVRQGLSQAECEASCGMDSFCKGYTYDIWNRLCILKNSIGALRVEPRSVSVIFSDLTPRMSTAPFQILKKKDRAFPDAAYKTAQLNGYDDCADLCMRDDRCLGMNFAEAAGRCQLFSKPSEYSPKPGVILGIKQQATLQEE